MAKALFLGVVGLECLAPDWCLSSVTMLTVLVNLTLIKQSRLSVLNEMHTNSYTGPRLMPKSNTNTARQEEIQDITPYKKQLPLILR